MENKIFDIPEEMRTKGRRVDPVFSQDEDLYIRFNSVGEGGKVSHFCIKFNQSANRSKYSNPEWVLLPNFQKWGYGALRVEDIPDSITYEVSGVTHEFRAEHVPLEENYSHSEIRSYKEGRRVQNKHREILLKFRITLSRTIRVLRQPIS